MRNKLPTAEETLNHHLAGVYNPFGHPNLKSSFIEAIESHTASHTAALREENEKLKSWYSDLTKECSALRRRIEELTPSQEEEPEEYLIGAAAEYRTQSQRISELEDRYNRLNANYVDVVAENTRYRQALESIAQRWNKVAEHNDMRTALNFIQQDVFEALKNNKG